MRQRSTRCAQQRRTSAQWRCGRHAASLVPMISTTSPRQSRDSRPLPSSSPKGVRAWRGLSFISMERAMLGPAMKPDLPGARMRFDRFELDEAEARLTCAGRREWRHADPWGRAPAAGPADVSGEARVLGRGRARHRSAAPADRHLRAWRGRPVSRPPVRGLAARGAGVRGCAPVAQPALPRRRTRAGGVRDHPVTGPIPRGCEITSARAP